MLDVLYQHANFRGNFPCHRGKEGGAKVLVSVCLFVLSAIDQHSFANDFTQNLILLDRNRFVVVQASSVFFLCLSLIHI